MASDFRSSPFPLRHKAARLGWQVFHAIFLRLSPRPLHGWRAFWLRAWGARMGAGCRIYPGVSIWAPWNLECAEQACIGNGAELYNPARIRIGARAVVSQGAFLCTATHDDASRDFPLVTRPISIGADAWVGARAIILPGCDLGEGAIAGAGSVVTRSIAPWTVAAGNPAREIRKRVMKQEGEV
jgi:putative colanic acid biosynthesis acetyltransferase WcaF